MNVKADKVIDLNTLKSDGEISCPYCGKGRHIMYGAAGMESSACVNCRRLVLWDYDHHLAYRASARKYS